MNFFTLLYHLIIDILVLTQQTVLWIITGMINKMLFFKCLHSPALYLNYNIIRDRWEKYHPNDLEVFGDRCLKFIKFCIKYSSPIWLSYFYRRDYFTFEGMMTLTKISVAIGVTLTTSCCIRSYGRLTNPRYIKFLKVLDDSSPPWRDIKQYDFDFSSWPVEYEYNQEHAIIRQQNSPSWRSTVASLIKSPCSVIGYVVLHTFGIRMIYPGSTSILNFLLFNALLDGRKTLLESKKGSRYKIKTKDSNYIDTMFVDRRQDSAEGNGRGSILVICSEGNAGFYENGIMTTAIEAGYSVLGWNHPGFGCSTGMPYLDQEQNAMETVMQFAKHKLGFHESQIILYGWSIGGYATTWAARHYREVKAVVLDATFDDILPLALNQMPQLLEPLVKLTIRCYADLNVSANLAEYQGTVKLIRRTQDEIISTDPGNIATNRGNMLLSKLLKRRYPVLVNSTTEDILYQWLNTTAADHDRLLEEFGVNKPLCKEILERYKRTSKYPYLNLGEGLNKEEKTRLLLYLADSYMTDYDANHVTMLPPSIFGNVTAEL